MTVLMERILGIDPGYGRLGYAVIEVVKHTPVPLAYGVITTPANARQAERILEIVQDLRGIIAQHAPTVLVMEELFFAKSTTTALKVAEVRGAVLLLAAEAGMTIVDVKPNEVKLALTGYGNADKTQMIAMVKTVFALSKSPKIDDAADALAIAWTGATIRR